MPFRRHALACLAVAAGLAGCVSSTGSGTGAECQSDGDCEGGYVCLREACVKICTTSADCAALGFDCVDDICVQPAPGECGNGRLAEGEECDDTNQDLADGCDDRCHVEGGWFCTDEPSVCTLACGNGVFDVGETCDDGDTDSGDGCSDICRGEPGWVCVEVPSVCAETCGDSDLDNGEQCDDAAFTNGDGCSANCVIENGWVCDGTPSLCATVCGDGFVRGLEQCDDGDLVAADGCSPDCVIESGYVCRFEPSVCDPDCADGAITGVETCDDGDLDPGDGCSALCALELGWDCVGAPSLCSTDCGDGLVAGPETCDDLDTDGGDGCDANCLLESGYACPGQPSVCATVCGDGLLRGAEQCDDHGVAIGDGCSGLCAIEANSSCAPGEPSVCSFDATPDTFSFAPLSDVERSTVYDSSSISLSGFFATLAASVSPAAAVLIKNGGIVANGALVSAGDAITLRVTSSPSFATITSVVLSVGAQVTVWNVTTRAEVFANCKELRDGGRTTDGVYSVDPDGSNGAAPFDVYCDQTTDGGGWTLVMRADRNFTNSVLAAGGTLPWFGQTGQGSFAGNGASFTTNQANDVWKWSDVRINQLVTEAYRVKGDGVAHAPRTRFWSGACVYSHAADPTGTACGTSFADPGLSVDAKGGQPSVDCDPGAGIVPCHAGLSDWAPADNLSFILVDIRNGCFTSPCGSFPEAVFWWTGTGVEPIGGVLQYAYSEGGDSWQLWVR